MNQKNPVVHFEMPADDSKRMSEFYTKAFGWKTMDLGEQMQNYVLVTTTDTDENGMIQTPGSINGGFYPRDNSMPSQGPSVVIAVGDIKKAMSDIKEAGGNVIGKPQEIPGYGMYVYFIDTEGNRVSLMEPIMREEK